MPVKRKRNVIQLYQAIDGKQFTTKKDRDDHEVRLRREVNAGTAVFSAAAQDETVVYNKRWTEYEQHAKEHPPYAGSFEDTYREAKEQVETQALKELQADEDHYQELVKKQSLWRFIKDKYFASHT